MLLPYEWVELIAEKLFTNRMDYAHQHFLWGMASEDILQCVGGQGEVSAARECFSQTQERDNQAAEMEFDISTALPNTSSD